MISTTIRLVLTFGLLAGMAGAMNSPESVSLDLMGSDADNASIVSLGSGPVDVDIIGSSASNIQIGFVGDHEDNTECGMCYCGECCCDYTTIWDDFRRPLCYPWSSYIPTRYNRPFHAMNNGYGTNSASYEYNGYPVAYLGRYYQEFS